MKLPLAAHLDVHRHLAMEELLLDRVGQWGPSLYFWRATNAVVIGKNQNPWRECRVADFLASGGCIGRRVSGGGAVYHDEGNLNYALFLPRGEYRADVPYEIVLRALRRLGAPAERLGRTSIGVGGQKLSGNAFCFRRNGAMHHGTLLVQADLGRLQSVLTPHRGGFSTHAIRSEPSPVTNLADLVPGLDIGVVQDAMKEEFLRAFGQAEEPVPEETLGDEAFSELLARHRSWEWQFGQTPAFDYEDESGTQVRVERGLVAASSGGQAAVRWQGGARFEA